MKTFKIYTSGNMLKIDYSVDAVLVKTYTAFRGTSQLSAFATSKGSNVYLHNIHSADSVIGSAIDFDAVDVEFLDSSDVAYATIADLLADIDSLSGNFNSGGGSPQLFKGKYTSLSALQTAHSTANIGEYAQVDVGIGSNVVNYIWDEQDGWVKSFISDLNFSQAEKDNINNKVGYFHKYIAPTENYITGHVLETEVYKFTVSGGTLSNIDRISLEELSVFHSAAPTGTDGVRIRISTNGVFSTSLPVIATFSSNAFFTNSERNSITFRNGNIIVFYNINGFPTDNTQGASITRIPYNTANNYTFHISIQLANPANSACLNALIINR